MFGSPYGNLSDAVSVLFYSANWHSYECVQGLVKACGINNGLYWSLALEEQFYIVLPLVMVFARKYLVAICVVGIIIQLPFNRPIFSALWITRTDALLLGVLIALARERPDSLLYRPGLLKLDAVRIPMLAFILIGMSILAIGSVVSFSVSLLAIGAGALVWAASFNEGLLFRKQHRILVWIGGRSYAIYLVHSICFFATMELLTRIAGGTEQIKTPGYSVALMAIGLCLTALVAEISARYLEKPLQNYGRRAAEQLNAEAALKRPYVGH
jgi:peptidoglycan/LPS O-acetylase OafA/YrhL